MVFRLNPVALPSGQPGQTYSEFTLNGIMPFEIARDFQGALQHAGPLGPRHTSRLDTEIRDGAREGTYEMSTPNAFTISFDRPAPQLFAQSVNPSHPHLSLEPLPRGGLKLNDRGISTIFRRYSGRVWRITRIEDKNANAIVFHRNARGLLERLVHPSGVDIVFLNRPDGLRAGFDAVAKDGSRETVMRYEYDAKGRLIAADNAFGESWRFQWDADDRRIAADNGAGTRVRHVYDDQGRVVGVDTGGGYRHGKIDYHPNGRLISVYHGIDGAEFEKFWFDAEGRNFMTADAQGRISHRHYNDLNQLIAEIDPNGHKTRFGYDAFGNTQSIRGPEGQETFLIWDSDGNLLSRTEPGGATSSYTYDPQGNLIESRDPLGHVTNFRTTDVGLPSQTMRHDGLIEFRSYDDQNRLVSLIDFNSAETRFAYDAFNRLTTLIDPVGNVTRLDYTPTKGADFNTPTRVIRADGVETARTFTPSGRIEAVTDGEGRKTRYHYGAYNVLEAITDPRGHDIRFRYDSRERLTRVTNQMGLHWTFERDTTGRVLRETDFDGRTLRYSYDDAGRVIRRGSPDGAWLEYDYTQSGQLSQLRAFAKTGDAPLITSYDYDENGALIHAANAAATIDLARDAMGRITAETVNGVTIESDIDCCGKRSARRFAGQELTFSYDGMGGLAKWALAGHAPLRVLRDAMGQELRRTNDTGFALDQAWDAVGQLTHQKAGTAAERAYTWSRAFEPTQIADRHWGQKTYDYDANGQIARTTHGDGKVEAFAYTPDLNITATGDADRFTNWQTTAAGVVKLARGPNGEVVTLEHDACGRVVQRTVARNGFRPQRWRFGWNAQDQLISAACPDGDVWTYAYDPFGRRVSKHCKHTKTTFLWDGDVIAREITEARGGPQTVDWFFEPNSFRPMARLEGGNLSYVINDHLGTPKEVIGADGYLLWSADHDTWGTLRTRKTAGSTQGEEDNFWLTLTDTPDSTTAKAYAPEPAHAYCPIRFQGQWEDAETGLYYNRARYYDPAASMFAQPDPARLGGGISLHAHVERPPSFADPLGLRGVNVRQGGPNSCADFILELSRSVSPETAGHISDAIDAGHPNTVTADRKGPVAQRRRQSTGPHRNQKCCGYDLDEWPMAKFREGGMGASVRSILAADNRGAGSSIGHALRDAGLQNGQTVCFVTPPRFLPTNGTSTRS